jgi:hypothetical protein
MIQNNDNHKQNIQIKTLNNCPIERNCFLEKIMVYQYINRRQDCQRNPLTCIQLSIEVDV